MRNILGCMVLTLLAVSTPAWAQRAIEITGKWEMTNDTPRGTVTTVFTFEQHGDTLTGTEESRGLSTPIRSGTVEGDRVCFSVVRAMRNRTRELTYTGTVEGDTITGNISTPRGNREFVMRRVGS